MTEKLCLTQLKPGLDRARMVLLVDDSRSQRSILRALLNGWGYQVIEAASGGEALAACDGAKIDIVISDWMMPGMNGIEFCTRFRALDRAGYGYFILLTSKSETTEIVQGLEVGADDFLTKPVNPTELRARLVAGERILGMQEELNSKNKLVETALHELRGLYDIIDRDLAQARHIQESLVPERFRRLGPSQISMLIKPCGHVGGDLVGMFTPGPNRLGFFNIDVSGHGVTSALMTARLAGYLSGKFLEQNIALERRFDRFFAMRPPDEVAHILNERLLSDQGVEEYFTMALGIADLATGRVRLVQAGHPHPLIQRADGRIEFVGNGGLPVGLVPDARYESFDILLGKGDRVLLYSDGITESLTEAGEMIEQEGLAQMLAGVADLRGPEVLDNLFWALTEQRHASPLADDVSAVLLEYHGPE